MMATTPSGTRTCSILSPLGRTQPSTTWPTGSASAATWRSPSAIASTRAAVRRRRSTTVGDTPAPARLAGFLRLAVMGYALGFRALTDTYTLANTTPNIVYDLLVGGILSATLVPVFVHHTEQDDDEGTSAVMSVAAVALFVLTV